MGKITSYERHSQSEATQASNEKFPSCFTTPDSVDAWRHRRMHEMLNSLIEAKPGATWLTVGDGSFGSDAYFLQQKGVDVVASSLTDHSLRIAAEKGLIRKYAVVNAEDISYEDESFDFVLCKEAYHHFPRPSIAFYEMLRVAKDAVVLIEPYDGPKRFLDMIKEPMKKLLWGKSETIYFEPSGNFIYRINPKQIGKKLAAMGYATVAYKTFNDIFLPKYGKSRAGSSFGYLATRVSILLQDLLCGLRLLNPALITVITFKQMPSGKLTKQLKKVGFTFDVMPVNPYV